MSTTASRTEGAPWRWAWIGAVLGFLLGVLVYAPAGWLAVLAETGSGGRVQLHEARGTVWNGSARLALGAGGERAPMSSPVLSLPGRLQWRLAPMLWGVRLTWRAACCMSQEASATFALQQKGFVLTLSDGDSRWPAQWLRALGTPWNTIDARGDLDLHLEGVSFTRHDGRLRMAGTARLDAVDISSNLSTLRPMGSYRVLVRGGEAPTLALSTLRGSLRLSGTGQWTGGRLRFAGEATAAPEHRSALDNLLNIIGRRNGDRSIIQL
ncbi:type II secretion system protein N [Candidatus Symbiobacter mobilis]|uniref:Type II secretion system protein N n=1 Tax=Candidatus Symbiobacter mobilis CR TaxID=946483 RepID=U5N8W7_9BURK|nr:type II secretion system protein N [Candidatus Symbiobacter mobilis]AGX87770.1 general secretion pathway protein N [Candidatus Symbiobacter mobilis CR]